jgi:hypothetical protein
MADFKGNPFLTKYFRAGKTEKASSKFLTPRKLREIIIVKAARVIKTIINSTFFPIDEAIGMNTSTLNIQIIIADNSR